MFCYIIRPVDAAVWYVNVFRTDFCDDMCKTTVCASSDMSHSLRAVSYTHLDVYKRQVMDLNMYMWIAFCEMFITSLMIHQPAVLSSLNLLENLFFL